MSNVPRREDHALPEIYAYGASVPSKPLCGAKIAFRLQIAVPCHADPSFDTPHHAQVQSRHREHDFAMIRGTLPGDRGATLWVPSFCSRLSGGVLRESNPGLLNRDAGGSGCHSRVTPMDERNGRR
jgi:hypothetical protein